jgi:hypothetical protein
MKSTHADQSFLHPQSRQLGQGHVKGDLRANADLASIDSYYQRATDNPESLLSFGDGRSRGFIVYQPVTHCSAVCTAAHKRRADAGAGY